VSYRTSFIKGERAAWFDRRSFIPRAMPEVVDEETRGFVDGYTPRSSTWALGINNRPVIEWWRESEAA